MAGDSRIKAKDVALAAKVSVSAVSRTFTPGASVSPDTRARIIAVADALGYRPNALARGLTTRRTQLVGLVMLRAHTPFFGQFLGKLNKTLAAEGRRTLLLLIDSRSEADEALEQALDYSVDGLIFVSSEPSTDAAARAARSAVPMVVMDRGAGAPTGSLVWTDGRAIGQQVADVFIAEKRKRAVAVSGFSGHPQPRELSAFASAMQNATGCPVPIIQTGATYEDGLALANTLLTSDDPPDAIFTATDYLAIGIYDAARFALGLTVPEQLSIVGLGDVPQTRWLSHAITTIRPPIDLMVKTAVELLVARIDDPSIVPATCSIDAALVRRDTTLAV